MQSIFIVNRKAKEERKLSVMDLTHQNNQSLFKRISQPLFEV